MPYINNSWSLKEFKDELKREIIRENNQQNKEGDNTTGPSYLSTHSNPEVCNTEEQIVRNDQGKTNPVAC